MTSRVQRLLERAEAEQWPPAADRGAMVSRVFAETAHLPRKLQIARALADVVEGMPIHIAPDELIIGARTVEGYPEHLEAIEAGSAEPGYMIADYPRVLEEGFVAILEDLKQRLAAGPATPETEFAHADASTQLESMIVACEAGGRILRLLRAAGPRAPGVHRGAGEARGPVVVPQPPGTYHCVIAT